MYTKLKALVAVSAASISFDKAFSYLIPESLAEKAVPGVRVLIPFGKGNRKRVGLILRVEKLEEHEKKRLFPLRITFLFSMMKCLIW